MRSHPLLRTKASLHSPAIRGRRKRFNSNSFKTPKRLFSVITKRFQRPHLDPVPPPPRPILPDHDTNPAEFRKHAEDTLRYALNNSYTIKTEQNYGYAVKRFIKFAVKCGIAEEEALPCSEEILCLFIASGVGRTGVGTANANLAAIAAWHKSRSLPFLVPVQMQTIKRAIKLHWPQEKQQKPPRPPVTPAMMRLLAVKWNGGSPRELCALALALAAWTGQMRLGELMAPALKEMDRSRLPSRKHSKTASTLERASIIHLPWTKKDLHKGDIVVLPHQHAPLDASVAVCHHILASPLDDDALLCEYSMGGKTFIFDKEEFMNMCNQVWQQDGIARITGHSFRIGGTTAYLMAGVDSDFVKKMGRWSSDAFLRYWRKLDELFATHASLIDFVDFDI